EQVSGELRSSGSRPDCDLIGMARPRSGGHQFLTILRNLIADGGHKSSVFFFDDLILPLVDPVQINLIEAEIAGCGRIVSVAIRSEIEMVFAGHHYMHSAALHVCNGEP